MAGRRTQRDQRGAAAVEFALIMPIFLMLLFGIIDFGYMINRSSVVNNAARDAAREASLGGTEAQIRAVATASLNGVPDAVVTVACRRAVNPNGTCVLADAVTGDTAIVTVRYHHDMLTPMGMFVGGDVDLTRKVEMRIE